MANFLKASLVALVDFSLVSSTSAQCSKYSWKYFPLMMKMSPCFKWNFVSSPSTSVGSDLRQPDPP